MNIITLFNVLAFYHMQQSTFSLHDWFVMLPHHSGVEKSAKLVLEIIYVEECGLFSGLGHELNATNNVNTNI